MDALNGSLDATLEMGWCFLTSDGARTLPDFVGACTEMAQDGVAGVLRLMQFVCELQNRCRRRFHKQKIAR